MKTLNPSQGVARNMAEVNLLEVYNRKSRSPEEIKARVAAYTDEIRETIREFGEEYFDGDSLVGYGGYTYDKRWIRVAKKMKEHYGLSDDAKVLDVGCAKGYLVYDFMPLLPNGEVRGIDISEYAISQAFEEVRPFLQVGSATHLPFEDNYFDLVISINVIHNLDYDGCVKALSEIERVTRKDAFVMVNAWRSEQERESVVNWDQAAQTCLHVDEWKALFAQAGYTKDYYWFNP